MRRVCLVQARMGSTRLPGKVLRDLLGQPMLVRQLHRLEACAALDELVIATSDDPADDPIAEVGAGAGVRVVRGSRDDVLTRYVKAARMTEADVVVRITADCPLIDPGLVDVVTTELTANAARCDYASNVIRRTYPRGLDVEAMFADTLHRIDRLATTGPEREHVTITVRSVRPELFLVRSVEDPTDNSDLRWTVDEAADFDLIRRIYEDLGLARTVLPYREILRHVRAHPELTQVNQNVQTWNPPGATAETQTERGAR